METEPESKDNSFPGKFILLDGPSDIADWRAELDQIFRELHEPIFSKYGFKFPETVLFMKMHLINDRMTDLLDILEENKDGL